MKFFITILCAFVVLFVYFYPHIVPISTVNEGKVYLGQNSHFDPWDVNLYVSAILYGQRETGITLPNLYTSIPNNPVYIYTPLVLIGNLFKNIDPFLLYHIATLTSSCILLVVLVYSLRLLGYTQIISSVNTLLISLAGGFGFLFQNLSADITSSAFTFHSTYQKPHEAIAIASLILAHVLFFKKRRVLLNSLVLIPCAVIYPYFTVSFAISNVLYVFLSVNNIKKGLFRLIQILLVPFPVALFFAYQFIENPTFGAVGSNLGVFPLPYFLGYGVVGLLCIYYLFAKNKSDIGYFLLFWLGTVLILSILPFGPGKVFLRGSFFPATLIALISIPIILKKIRIDKTFIYGVFVVTTITTSIVILGSRFDQSYSSNQWVFMEKEEHRVIQYLKSKTKNDSTVFTHFRLSNQIPAFTNNRVYLGHMLQTPNSNQRQNEALSFVSRNGSESLKKEFLDKNNIDYVIWGPEEEYFYTKGEGSNKVKDYLKSLDVVYKSEKYTLYKTN